MNNEVEDGISLADIFNMLKKNILIIIASILIFLVIGFIFMFGLSKPKYKSNCMVMVQYETSTSQTDISNSLRIVGTVAEFIKSDLVAKKAYETIKVEHPNVTYSMIAGHISTSYGTTSQNIVVSFESTDSKIVKDVVEEIIFAAEEIANTTLNSEGGYYYSSIRNAISKVGEATEAKDVSTSKKLLTIIFFMVGAVIGVGVAFLKEALDSTCKSKEEIEKLTSTLVIGMIPDFDKGGSKK